MKIWIKFNCCITVFYVVVECAGSVKLGGLSAIVGRE